MDRGVSSGGGQSSLGYLFGSGEPSKPPRPAQGNPKSTQPLSNNNSPVKDPESSASSSMGKFSSNSNRAAGQNSRNFSKERPSTKVQCVPGGASSLGYLFGDKE